MLPIVRQFETNLHKKCAVPVKIDRKMLISQVKTSLIQFTSKRCLWHWLNIMFNRLDADRRKELGPDRTCAEWLLRNGASVKWLDATEFLSDYNKLPPEGTPMYVREVDATESSISHYGFEHFLGCKFITRVILHNCSYVENKALHELHYLKESLKFLQVSSCHNIDEGGLQGLKVLKNLEKLVLFDLSNVSDKKGITEELSLSLKNCDVMFK